ncbi:MAG: hypothetical protein ACI8PT_002120 [Gammaproteobacteria bacterium]|jgi:hypothetical protein
MKLDTLKCWRCEASLADVMLPLSRFAECPECRADLRVCRLCVFYSPRSIGKCTHDRAELVEVKDRANFCEHFRPTSNAHSDGSLPERDDIAKRAFEDLFEPDTSSPSTDAMPIDPASLFDVPAEPVANESSVKRDLDALFGLTPDKPSALASEHGSPNAPPSAPGSASGNEPNA